MMDEEATKKRLKDVETELESLIPQKEQINNRVNQLLGEMNGLQRVLNPERFPNVHVEQSPQENMDKSNVNSESKSET